MEKITKIRKEKGFVYRIDKEGNVIKDKYNLMRDPYTVVVIAIIILSAIYYLQISQMRTVEKNFESSCNKYVELKGIWVDNNPGKIPTLEEVFSEENQNNLLK